MLDVIIQRLKDEVAFLEGRVEGAADFTNLVEQRKISPYATAAHVIPTGLRGGAADAASGLFRQTFDEAISVLISIRSNDATGKRALENLNPNLMAVVEAIAGWAPDDQIGVFRLVNGRVVSMTRGAFIYELNFAIQDQLRIPT